MIVCKLKRLEEVVLEVLLIATISRISTASPHLPRFSSHVSFSSPAGSFSHGVGDLHHSNPSRIFYDSFTSKPYKKSRFNGPRTTTRFPTKRPTIIKTESLFFGYPKEKPLIPFPTFSNIGHENSLNQHTVFNTDKFNNFNPYNVPILPPSPYMVDSPNPESLWPEGLFLPPSLPVNIAWNRHNDKNDYLPPHDGGNSLDPFLLDGIEAVEALERINAHGELFHHEIPHVQSLLRNQQLRLDNGLHPNRLGSIRKTSPWYRE